ncbi:hypothetical protein [Kitasatospora griseola]
MVAEPLDDPDAAGAEVGVGDQAGPVAGIRPAAATASAPGAVLGDLSTDLPRLCELVDQALAIAV